MPSKKEKHIHRFRRHTYKSTGNSVFFCTMPDCQFKLDIEFAIGKVSLCNRCGQPFEMNSYAIRLVKPHCPECHNSYRETGHGGDRRVIPTRRELDPTIIKQVADQSLASLRSRLEGTETSTIRPARIKELFESDENDDDPTAL